MKHEAKGTALRLVAYDVPVSSIGVITLKCNALHITCYIS